MGDMADLVNDDWPDDDGPTREDMMPGCCFPGRCCMPGPHLRGECHTPEMIEAWEAEPGAGPGTEDSDG